MKKKFLFILFIILFMFISLSSQCFAVINNNSFTYNGKVYTLSESLTQKFSHYLFCEYGSQYLLVLANGPITRDGAYFYGTGIYCLTAFKSDHEDAIEYIVSKEYPYEPSSKYGSFSLAQGDELIDMWYCNEDILDKNGDVLFQVPPPVTVLTSIVEEVETEKTLEEIVLILPLILVIVVSYLGLRKALRMLSTILRRS